MMLQTDAKKCCGCRICEVLCTFHHKKSFGRRASSIQVRRLERRGEFEIVLHKGGNNLRSACDLCKGEEKPLCVKFCPSGAITVMET